MLTVEAGFKQAMETLWPTEVACTVSGPDERWVKDEGDAKACVQLVGFKPTALIRTGREARYTAGTEGTPGTKVTRVGKCEMLLEVHLATVEARVKLHQLAAEFVQAFHLGTVFELGEDSWQIMGTIEATRVRAQRGGPSVTAWMFAVPVRGTFEESTDAYSMEKVEDEVEVEGEAAEVLVVEEEGN